MLDKISITLMVIYPAVAYTALWLEKPLLLIAYILLIVSLYALKQCLDKHLLTGISLFILVAVIGYFMQQPMLEYLVYLPPLFIFLSLFMLFFTSLREGETPLITRYAMRFNDNLEEKHLRYHRALTMAWAIFLFSMAAISIILAVFFSKETWSLFTHVISYGLIGAFFILEFSFRKYHFAGEIEGGFFQFILKIIKVRPTNLK